MAEVLLAVIAACLGLALVWAGTLLVSNLFDAPWVPLGMRTVDRMLEMANIKPGETVMDLGSGDARVLIRAARKHKARGVGVEINPLMAWISILDINMRRVGRDVELRRQNMHKADISKADVIITYLLPKANGRLEKKVMNEAKQGARVISYAFKYPNWGYIHKEPAGAGNIYVYHKNW
jgi:hypothetical protein